MVKHDKTKQHSKPTWQTAQLKIRRENKKEKQRTLTLSAYSPALFEFPE